MALNALESNTIARGKQMARKILEEVKPILDGLNVAYDTATVGVKATVVQQDLDEDSSLSALTKQQLDDAMYAMTATIKGAIDAAYVQLAQLAARA